MGKVTQRSEMLKSTVEKTLERYRIQRKFKYIHEKIGKEKKS